MLKKTSTTGSIIAAAALLVACSNTASEVESALSSASSAQSSVMSSAESQANSMMSEASSVANEATAAVGEAAKAFEGFGAEIQSPEGFDPLGTGKIYGGAYKVTAHSIDQLEENYASTGGAAEFDLSGLQPLAEDRTVNIFVHEGDVKVALPSIVPVRAVCNAGNGTAECSPETYNPGATGGTLTLNIETHQGAIGVNP